MKVVVRYFASFRRALHKEREEVEMEEGTTLRALMDLWTRRYPELEDLSELALFSINLEHAGPEKVLKDGDEVGIFPPLSGG